jgi:hypothetical protein
MKWICLSFQVESYASSAVPDQFTGYCSVDYPLVNEEMDLFSLDSSWSRYEIDCALQSQDFYSSSKKEMPKVNKVMT